MQVVSPYRPFPPESRHHQALGLFDWINAFRMMAASVEATCGCEARLITDVDTDVPVPAFTFHTYERRLMLWMLEVSLKFLESKHFDQDTVLVCPDLLVYGDLRPFFRGDLGLVVRTALKYQAKNRTVVNGVQWWAVAGKARLIPFYRLALAIAKTLPESSVVWGADTEPLRQLVTPVVGGIARRSGLTVHQIESDKVMLALSSSDIDRLQTGQEVSWPIRPVVDFRCRRKHYMQAYFEHTFGVAA